MLCIVAIAGCSPTLTAAVLTGATDLQGFLEDFAREVLAAFLL